MRPDLAALPPRYLRTKEAADFLSLSARTLEKHRTYGTGPAYHKLGGRVVYSVEDLAAWVARGSVTSTSDPRGQVLPAKPLPPTAFTSPKRITRCTWLSPPDGSAASIRLGTRTTRSVSGASR